jgi:hypothetical protein
MDLSPDSYPPPPKPPVLEQSFFRKWRDFAIGLALLIAVMGGYIWFAQSTLPSTSSDRPETKTEFPASTSAPSSETAPTSLHEQGKAP